MLSECVPNALGIAPIGKVCSKCGEWKSFAQLDKAKNGKYGLLSCCKACRAAYQVANRESIADKKRKHYVANREVIAESQRQYRERNHEKNAEYNRQYREKNRERLIARDREYYATHREARAEYDREYREKNREARAEYDRQYREKNPEQALERLRQWHAANPDYYRVRRAKNRPALLASDHRRRARIAGNGGECTVADLAAIRAAQTDRKGRLICWRCGKPIKGTPDLDHFIPLKLGGPSTPGNLHYMHATCNRTKSAKHPHELGMLI